MPYYHFVILFKNIKIQVKYKDIKNDGPKVIRV